MKEMTSKMASNVRVVFTVQAHYTYRLKIPGKYHPCFEGHFDVIIFKIRCQAVLTKLFPV
jgi:hypothetical protein